MSFEDKMKRIEEISAILEEDKCSFEDSVKLYEEASLLIKECFEIVNKSSGKIKEIAEDLSIIDFEVEN